MSARRKFSAVGDATMSILRRTVTASEAFPPLRALAETALDIAGLVENFRSNKTDWEELGVYVQELTANVIDSLAGANSAQADNAARIEKLKGVLSEALDEIRTEQYERRAKRMNIDFHRDEEKIRSLRARIDEAIQMFQIGTTIRAAFIIERTHDAVEANHRILSGLAEHASSVRAQTATQRETSRLGTNAALGQLWRARGASWDVSRVCLANTRVKLVDEILSWGYGKNDIDGEKSACSNEPSKTNILLLTGVAGAGKSTIAHTVAQRCSQRGLLASSFFFQRGTKDRDTPDMLFTTLAADIARLDQRLSTRIAATIEDDTGLPFAPIATQFEKLILEPCQEYPFARPVMVVIDGLDEGWNEDLLEILRDRVCRLPSTFRILVTSRMQPELDSLCRRAHVRRINMDIGGEENIDDISEYSRHRLWKLADHRNLGDDWPGDELRARFVSKAGGLFLWVATVCDYLRSRGDPTKNLRELVERDRQSDTSAENRMDRLYATILESYDWTDEDFVASYNQVMGAAIASKTPLTISGIKELYNDQYIESDYTLQKLSPLLTGMSRAEHQSSPVRLLHQSLRDFLVLRSRSCSQYSRFTLDERMLSSKLAALCLSTLNRDLSRDMPITGYLSARCQDRGVPRLDESMISEALWYSCRFWSDHVCDIVDPGTVKVGLTDFMENHIVKWLEIVASCGQCRDLAEVRKWIEDKLPQEAVLQVQGSYTKYADTCWDLSGYLDYDDRREESLIVTKESVVLYRQLAAKDPDIHLRNLATQINNLSRCFSYMGQHEEGLALAEEAVMLRKEVGRYEDALPPIQESVDLCRKLAEAQPAVYTSELANSLHELSARLSRVDRYEDALSPIQEAVVIRRKLAEDRPAVYTPSLANSLHELSARLSKVGRYEDGLPPIQEAVDIRRKLATDRPAVYTSDLASSLHELSARLSRVGRYEDALPPIQEAVDLRRKLVADRPAVYTSYLASSLHELSVSLSEVGRYDDGLPPIQEAVDIRRKLVADRPAVYEYRLAQSLIVFSASLFELGRQKDALQVSHEAIILQRNLAVSRPNLHLPGVAMSLYNISIKLSKLNRHEEALEAIQESTEIYRQLARARPAVFQEDYKDSLYCLSDTLLALRREPEARVANIEANKS
ncbi:hypothetical protein RhiJN_21123 [Ceratobasidium sp. AG-Ba]|nr:hypothetical protein RhiJN_21123 [Ceratobasidium sp. AG-Ba]